MERKSVDATKFKEKLEEELAILEGELGGIGIKSPTNPQDWEPKQTNTGQEADRSDTADLIESFEENSAILKELETRYNHVKLALKKIEEGTYGICEIGGKPIEVARLEANPAARTCKAHLDELEDHS